jgi:hypothetical protein
METVVAAGERKRIGFRMLPSQAYLADLGALYLRQMVDALGPAARDASVRGAGTLYLRDEAGKIAAWSIFVWSGAEGLSRVEASRFDQRHTFSKTQSGAWKDSGARQAPQLANAIALLDSALLPRRIEALQAGGATIARDGDGSGRQFRTAGASGSYVVTLDSLSRPGEIECKPEGEAPPATYLYSEYSETAGLLWPRLIDVARPGSLTAIAVRFSTVERTRAPDDSGRGSFR